MDGLLKGGQRARAAESDRATMGTQWKLSFPQRQPSPLTGFFIPLLPLPGDSHARLVQQSRNKTTLINANWGEKQQTAYTFKFYTELVRANSSFQCLGENSSPHSALPFPSQTTPSACLSPLNNTGLPLERGTCCFLVHGW